jgi:hypothetical protein
MKRNVFKCAVVFIFLFPLLNASAQSEIFFGVKGGISIPNLKAPNGDNPVSSGWSSRQGPYFGLVSEFMFSRHFSLQVELNYSSQGGKKDGVQGIASSDFFNPNPVPAGVPKFVYATYKNEA